MNVFYYFKVTIFITLSDLTRYQYPPRETLETSRCDYKDYQFRSRGVLQLRGLTKDGRIVVVAKYLMPWRLITSRSDLINGLHLQVKTDLNQVKGSLEITKRRNIDTFLNEDIQVDFTQRRRGIFIFYAI